MSPSEISVGAEQHSLGLFGASGYVGQELSNLIDTHPGFDLEFAMGSSTAPTPDPAQLPVDRVVDPLDLERLADVDAVFLCTPHGASAELASTALAAGCKVVDLSADFRLRDPQLYAATYGLEHPAPELLTEAVYGLTEHQRAQVAEARLVANPGCYPTSVLLPLLPLLQADLIESEAPIIADCKSGLSGAGRKANARTHFGSVHENFLAYGVGTHRHTPEIHQVAGTNRISFVPHLLPVMRGILSTIYFTPTKGISADEVEGCLAESYGAEPFVCVYPHGLPELDRVQGTNRCDMAVRQVGTQIAIVSVIDNLLKGAAGQALQNMNLLFGFDEGLGLPGALA